MPLMQLDVIEVGEKTEIWVTAWRMQGKLGAIIEENKTMTTLVSGGALGFAFTLVALVAISIVTSIFQVSKTISY